MTTYIVAVIVAAERTVIGGFTAAELGVLLTALGAGGALSIVVKSIMERSQLNAVAKKEEATAAEIVAGAAAELVNPLREELRTVRAELTDVKDKLAAMTRNMHDLTVECGESRRENTELEHENAKLKAQLLACKQAKKKP